MYILCSCSISLGTGKTVICLALVLATLRQVSQPEDPIRNTRPVMTPLAFKHFPSGEFASSRQRLFKGRKEDSHHIPSLVEILIHHSRTQPDTRIFNVNTPQGKFLHRKRAALVETLALTRCDRLCRSNPPFYFHYDDQPTNHERQPRHTANPGPQLMYLTSATLIVVPPNLLSQWDREILKHCDDSLRVLIVRTRTVLPLPQVLASQYDVSSSPVG